MLSGRILTPHGWIRGRLSFDRRIHAITEASDDERPHGRQRLILPGFVDLHVHGAAGVDIMQGGEAARTVAQTHARHGTTALLATTMTATPTSIERALRGMAGEIAQRSAQAARVLGAHLEGPFLSIKRLGAQPPEAVQIGSLPLVQSWHAMAPIRVMTLAPEVEGHLALIPLLVEMGIRVQLGHSNASYEEARAALNAGAHSITHLFNGMSGLHHQQPGLVGAALAHAEYAELIPDLQHVQPGALRAALRAIPRAYGVTDATAATGMPDGEYQLGSQRVMKCRGCVRLVLGDSLAGSALTMDQALRNLVEIGCDVADVSRRLSLYPADLIGELLRGRIAPGAHADLVVLNEQLQVEAVFVEGEPIALHPTGHPEP